MCVRVCNLCGLFPFRMVLDDETKQFKCFDHHWRHPANWWFLLLSISYPVFVTLFAYISWTLFSANQSPTIIKTAFGLYLSTLLVILSIPRLFALRFRNFERALETFRRIDYVLDKTHMSGCNVRRFTIIGITIILIQVVY